MKHTLPLQLSVRCGTIFRWILPALILVACWSRLDAADANSKWPGATPEKLPRWRGFNLLEKFVLSAGRKPFVEEDFRLISRLGFDFVRLPMDYRLWIKNGNWEEFDEATLREIDQAVEWGRHYGIHVCLNFHRAPGYTVANPPEKSSLWTDAETQRVCAKHWATFARRYKGIPGERLSFNLINEPPGLKSEAYVAVVRQLVDAIRAEDPDRLIISDGLDWGRKPLPEMRDLHVALATRGYSPMEISHYEASWVNSAGFPTPTWPRLLPPSGILLAPGKPEGSHPLTIHGPFAAETQLRMRVMTVSSRARLIAQADGTNIFQKDFHCGPGEGEWKKADFKPQWNTYQNLYDRDYTATIPVGTRKVQVRVTSGDWLHLGALGFKSCAPDARESVLALEQAFGRKPEPFRYAPDDPMGPFPDVPAQDRQWLWEHNIKPWQQVEVAGVGVMVGEWGAFNKTPHDVFLRWAEDNLANWKQAGWGWAMWNFRGAFGVLDTGRADVKHEDFEGHKLDRKLLDLLQRY